MKITVKDTTKNKGPGPAGESLTRFYLSTDKKLDAGDEPPLCSRNVPLLAAGTSSKGPADNDCQIPPGTDTGIYYIIAEANADDTLPESDKKNNIKVKRIRIVP